MSRIIVVKLGGEVVASPQVHAVAAGIRRLSDHGASVCVVHGAGPQLSALQKRLGIPVRQVAGRRYTDEDTLNVVKMVVAGQVNVDLCAALRQAGAHPVGLHGAVFATRRPPRAYAGAGPGPVDLGLVGDVNEVDVGLIRALWAETRLPVLGCLGVAQDQPGAIYNINADAVAGALAAKLSARQLILVSDSPVLRDVKDRESRIAGLDPAEAARLIRDGVVQGGMVAKLEEACNALAANPALREVIITTDLAENSTTLRSAP